MKRIAYILITLLATAYTLSSCSDDGYNFWSSEPEGNNIRVSGIGTEDMLLSTITRATGEPAQTHVPAETQPWLVQPLKNGLDITYGLYNATVSHQDVAILKLIDSDGDGGNSYDVQDGLAVYTFKYRADRSSEVGDGNDAIWYNNGFHYFQGVHVPDRLRYTSDNISDVETKAPNLVNDQHNDTSTGDDSQLGNYTLLSHYLGMPANFRLTATVERIKLPFRHRLARVVAFVLIDPELNTTLKGYKKNEDGTAAAAEDPNTTKIRFCNVQVLQGVKDVAETNNGDGGHHTLTPQWTTARKVIPHFDGERGSYNYKTRQELAENFLFYYKESATKDAELYPTTSGWKTAYNDKTNHNGYTEVNYGKVPVYDIIVRPTYTRADSVMYDEENYDTKKQELANLTNKIDFEIELENGLRYEKQFDFDLNANYQTVVYLRISREHVDYNAAGADLWIEERRYDGWYGVDNENDNTLSYVGSSWQRAYTYGAQIVGENHTDPNSQNGVTDGHFYNATSSGVEKEKAQYFTSADKDIWVERFLQAYQGGEHHGDYFILRDNIDIDARLIPENFVFTGHLDGQDHTITLTNVDEPVYKNAVNITEKLYTESASNYTEWNIPTLYVKLSTPVHYTEDELATVNGTSYVKNTLNWVEEQNICYTQDEADAENAKPEHHPLTTDSEGRKPGDYGYVDTRDMEHYNSDYTPLTTSTVKETIPAHYETTVSSVAATTADVKRYDITYPEATPSTSPARPTTLAELKTNEYYTDNHSGNRFTCPTLYQFSHNSQAILFSGLNGEYTTKQETAPDPYASGVIWEANVHKETNKSTKWVPTTGYRAEVLNVKMAGGSKLFKDDASISGNVQNCWNGTTSIPNHTPDIPRYK